MQPSEAARGPVPAPAPTREPAGGSRGPGGLSPGLLHASVLAGTAAAFPTARSLSAHGMPVPHGGKQPRSCRRPEVGGPDPTEKNRPEDPVAGLTRVCLETGAAGWTHGARATLTTRQVWLPPSPMAHVTRAKPTGLHAPPPRVGQAADERPWRGPPASSPVSRQGPSSGVSACRTQRKPGPLRSDTARSKPVTSSPH